MAYLVLARKYRPQTFEEVAGQEIILNTLRGAIESERIGHAYLFTGPRGTGKTTTARIFAKALNCESGPTANPCGTCERCVGMEMGAESDVIEIDAASNTSVEDVRALRDQAAYMPLAARFKIFIIDEVHMLSKAAFNALLKTLEEPPEHVKFLFATTEPHKVLDTILSRCQVMKLSPLPEGKIVARLGEVFAAEGIDPEAGVLEEIAKRARGGMRDALSIADQLLAMVGDAPRLVDIERLSGEGQGGGMAQVVRYILEGNKPALLGCLPLVEGSEADWLAEFLGFLRASLLATLCGTDAPMLNGMALAEGDRGELVRTGKSIGGDRLEIWLQELLHARERMRLLPAHGRLVLEVTLLDLCQVSDQLPLQDWLARLEALEQGLPAPSGPAPGSAPAPAAAPRAAATQPERPSGGLEGRASGAPQEALPARDVTPAPAPPNAPPRSRPESPGTAAELPPTQAPVAAAARSAAGPNMANPPQDSGRAAPRSTKKAPAGGRAENSKGRPGSASGAWDSFLESLGRRAPALADLMVRRARLAHLDPHRAVVELVRLNASERTLAFDRRNQQTLRKVMQEVVGDSVVLDLQDAAQVGDWQEDAFTKRVVDRFEGRVEG